MSLFTLRYRDTQLKGEGGRGFPIMDYGGLIQCMEEGRNLKGVGKTTIYMSVLSKCLESEIYLTADPLKYWYLTTFFLWFKWFSISY